MGIVFRLKLFPIATAWILFEFLASVSSFDQMSLTEKKVLLEWNFFETDFFTPLFDPGILIWTVLLPEQAHCAGPVSRWWLSRKPNTTYSNDDAKDKNIIPDVVASVAEYEAAKTVDNVPGTSGSAIAGPDSLCYDDLGCFTRVGNFTSFRRLPSTPQYMMTEFQLFTGAQQEEPDILDYGNASSVLESKFRKGQPIIFVVHGFGDSSQAQWYKDFKTAVLGKVHTQNEKNTP